MHKIKSSQDSKFKKKITDIILQIIDIKGDYQQNPSVMQTGAKFAHPISKAFQ